MDSKQQAVLTTLLYADLFGYPLTVDEIWQTLSSPLIKNRSELRSVLAGMKQLTAKDKEVYFLKGRDTVSRLRRNRELHSRIKLQAGRDSARWLSLIPSVLCIGISGSVAANNARKSDDIDLFVITKRGTVFATRVLLLGLLQLQGKRRQRKGRKEANNLCLNFMVDEESLSFTTRADVYTAHELLQLIPLYERDSSYTKLLKQNSWVKGFLPHASEGFTLKKRLITKRSTTVWTKLGQIILQWVEPLVRSPQLWYMKPHQTSEVVTPTLLAFHPVDYRGKTLSRFKIQKKRYDN